MSHERPLRGGCSCGRNRYTVSLPTSSSSSSSSTNNNNNNNGHDVAQVFFESGSEHRRHQATPLTAFLRIPLEWYQSRTYSYFPDESPSSIRRAYTSPSYPYTKRQFCGYCGTPLSYWTEQPPSEADFISLTLGSLIGEDLRELKDLGMVPGDAALDSVTLIGSGGNTAGTGVGVPQGSPGDGGDGGDGLDWFEELMEGSQLGRMSRGIRRRRMATTTTTTGLLKGGDGGGGGGGRTVSVEWEIVEWTGDDDGNDNDTGIDTGTAGNGSGNGNGKRKIGEVAGEKSGNEEEEKDDVDVDMKEL